MIPLFLFLLGCAAVYIGTVETAFTAMMRLSLRLLAERGGSNGPLSRYLDDPVLLYVPTRLISGVITALATLLVASLLQEEWLPSAITVLLAMGGFIGGCLHLLPGLIARRDPERVIQVLLPSFDLVARVMFPITSVIVGVARLLPERAGLPSKPADEQVESAAAAQVFLETGEQAGLIEGDERRLLRSIFDFGDTLVREVMTPRPDIAAIRADATIDELRTLFREEGYSRIPVYTDSLDNIVGMVVVKDLIQLKGEGAERRAADIMRPAYVVPETKRVAELLKEFQTRRVQAAIVVDEYGGTAGLVTLEDLIEEIVGDIRDEYDVEAEPIVDEGNGTFVFSGKVDIDEVVERLDVDIEREGFETVGGYVLSHVGRVPAVGETFEIDGLSLEVLEAERRRVTKVRIRRRQPVSEAVRE